MYEKNIRPRSDTRNGSCFIQNQRPYVGFVDCAGIHLLRMLRWPIVLWYELKRASGSHISDTYPDASVNNFSASRSSSSSVNSGLALTESCGFR